MPDNPRAMVCQEVAGGNTAYEGGLALPGLEAWVICRPYKGESGGGDVHYVSSCASGRITRMLVADVSGHGERVSQVSKALRDLMRKHVNYVDQTRVVRAMNTEFTRSSTGRFATAIVATFWEPGSRLVLCNAGHPRPLRRLAGGDWNTLSLSRKEAKANVDQPANDTAPPDLQDVQNLPLGIEELTRYEQLSTRLAPGEGVLLYTDAFIEARTPTGGQLGENGLRSMLAGRSIDDPAAFLRTLVGDLSDLTDGNLGDDATAMLIVRTRTRPSFVSGLAAPLRIAGSAIRRVAGGRDPVPWPESRLDNILGPFLPFLNKRR